MKAVVSSSFQVDTLTPFRQKLIFNYENSRMKCAFASSLFNRYIINVFSCFVFDFSRVRLREISDQRQKQCFG